MTDPQPTEPRTTPPRRPTYGHVSLDLGGSRSVTRYGRMSTREIVKEELVALWEEIVQTAGPTVTTGETMSVPADQVLVFIGGELPTEFLRRSGIEIDTHFGAP